MGAWDDFLGSAPAAQPSGGGAWQAFLGPQPQQSGAPRGGNFGKDDLVNGLVSRGLSPTVAHGIAMNVQDESGFNPGINERNPTAGAGGYGLIQWTGPRRAALAAYAQQVGKPINDPNVQMDFLVNELNGPQAASLKAMNAAQTPGQAADAFLRLNERPAAKYLSARSANYLGGQQTPTQQANAGGAWGAFLNG